MASLYQRPDSPYYWLKYRNDHGLIVRESTGCKVGIGPDARRAKIMEAEKTLAERTGGDTGKLREKWGWVPDFIRIRYSSKSVTRERYLCVWTTVKMFLDETAIDSPAKLTRHHCFDYMVWRQTPDKARGKYSAGTNTAILELKVLGIIMQEAVERGHVNGNPCFKLGIKKQRQDEKPELTEQDCQLIRAEIPKVEDEQVREMLSNSFEIARHQGCRLAETRLNPMTDVDLAAQTIRFRRAKGGKDFVTRLHPGLLPLFTKLQSEGKTSTWTQLSEGYRQWASSHWWRFLDRIGLKAKGITFHGTRVTVITELARANIHESKAMGFVGHSSTTVHRIYQRLRPADLSDCVAAVGSGKPGSSSNQGAPPGNG